MGWQMRQNAVDFLLHSLEIYGTLYLFYIALWFAPFGYLYFHFYKWAKDMKLTLLFLVKCKCSLLFSFKVFAILTFYRFKNVSEQKNMFNIGSVIARAIISFERNIYKQQGKPVFHLSNILTNTKHYFFVVTVKPELTTTSE